MAFTLHLYASSLALGLGGLILSMRKGTKPHRLLGRASTGPVVSAAIPPAASGRAHARHLMLQPMEGFWVSLGALPASTASTAARRSAPVTGVGLLGRLSSNWPR